MPRRILVTSALPYANGSMHLGHLIEHIQTDIWVRFQRMRGHLVRYVCADDTHGTPVMLAAEKAGMPAEDWIRLAREEHMKDFAAFGMSYDIYHSTHTPETQDAANSIYVTLRDAGYIAQKEIEQFYDPVKSMFLPDRYIRGTCPKCRTEDQYGDSCEKCGSTYAPTDLIDPRSALSGAVPERRQSTHYFFRLSACEAFLREWTRAGHVPSAAANKLDEWFDAGLQDWDISRDAPYFGFLIPGTTDKYFYVWMDAPIGYIGSHRALCNQTGEDFDSWWAADSDAELIHFIGKDILYFHALFWPTVLTHAGRRTPTHIFPHGFLTINGKKMSKSRGSFITARQYLDHLDPHFLRFYFAGKLDSSMDDIDLNFDDFIARVNSDLIGKWINLASRASGFITKRFDGQLAESFPEAALPVLATLRAAQAQLAEDFETREYARAMREIMGLTDLANQFVDQNRPWEIAKQEGRERDLQAVCTAILEMFRVVSVYLKPIIPDIVAKAEVFLQVGDQNWAAAEHPGLLVGKTIRPYEHLSQRVDPADVAALFPGEASE